MSGSTDDSNNIEGSMNTVFIPELDHEHFVLQQQHKMGSPDLVSLREGLGTSDGPTQVTIHPCMKAFLKAQVFFCYVSLGTADSLLTM